MGAIPIASEKLTKPPRWEHWASHSAKTLKEKLAEGQLRGWINPPPGVYTAEEFAAWVLEMQQAYPSFRVMCYDDPDYGDSQEFSVLRPLTKGEVKEIEELIEQWEHKEESADKATYDLIRQRHPEWFTEPMVFSSD